MRVLLWVEQIGMVGRMGYLLAMDSDLWFLWGGSKGNHWDIWRALVMQMEVRCQ